jgi:hypothetical protein
VQALSPLAMPAMTRSRAAKPRREDRTGPPHYKNACR